MIVSTVYTFVDFVRIGTQSCRVIVATDKKPLSLFNLSTFNDD